MFGESLSFTLVATRFKCRLEAHFSTLIIDHCSRPLGHRDQAKTQRFVKVFIFLIPSEPMCIFFSIDAGNSVSKSNCFQLTKLTLKFSPYCKLFRNLHFLDFIRPVHIGLSKVSYKFQPNKIRVLSG